jgi:hypothetical protein
MVFFYYFGRISDLVADGRLLARFCSSQGGGYALVGQIYQNGSYLLKQSNGSARGWWRMGAVHEVGHMFGLNHTPGSGNNSEIQNCVGCMGCFNAMDGWARVGCPNLSFDYIPYHGLHLQRLGWADFVSIPRDTTLYVRDFRVRPIIYKIKPDSNRNDFFALYNLQQTGYDAVVTGEGLTIVHARDNSENGWSPSDIWDVEIPQPMYSKAAGSNCPALPHVANRTKGVDTLQCSLGGNETHLWPYPETSIVGFGNGTNPWTRLYATSASAPHDSQSVLASLCLTTESLADSFISGKEMVKVVINIDCGEEIEGPMGAPLIGGEPIGGEVKMPLDMGLHVTTMGRAEGTVFKLEGGDLRGLDCLEVFSPTGRSVRTIRLQGASGLSSEGSVFWDGHNDGRERVASGVYLYRFIDPTGAVRASGRVLIVR